MLREFCDAHGRTPHRDEQAGIAAEQTARIAAAAARADVVVADTSAIMIAVYSEIVFGDTSLYAARSPPIDGRSSRSSWRSTCRGRPTACSATARRCARRSMR